MSRIVYRTALALATLMMLLVPTQAQALHHLASISEVMSGVGGDPSAQYVEIVMNAPSQNFVGDERVTAFNSDGTSFSELLVVPAGVPNSGGGVHWIVGTPSFATASGITPDFTWNPASTGNIPASGMVCSGSPGIASPLPGTWDPAIPDNYVDCVGYGGYTGPTKTSIHDGTRPSGTPTALPPGDGTLSLTRTGDSGNNVADFALTCPTPTNNAGQTASIGPCALPISGKKLTLKADPAHPNRRGLDVQSKSAGLTLGDGNGSADDPTLNGGSVRVVGAGFDDTYALPAANWTYIGHAGENKGYKFKHTDLTTNPIKGVKVMPGKLLKVTGKGTLLGHSLGSNPNPVDVTFAIGGRSYCMSFGGTATFKLNKQYLAKDAPAQVACQP